MCLSSVYVNRALYIFDLDGVIYRGNNPQPYAAETIAPSRLGMLRLLPHEQRLTDTADFR